MYQYVFFFIFFTAVSICLCTYNKSTGVVCVTKRRLAGRSAVVTGGTRGLGLQVAIELARRGAHLTVAARSESGALQTLRAAAPQNSHIHFQQLDMSSLASVRRFADHVRTTHPSLHVLVNNAGIGGPNSQTGDGLNLVLQVNYYSTFLLTLLLLPLLKKSSSEAEPSRIVNVGSLCYIYGRECFDNAGFPKFSPLSYPTSKLYLTMFTRELARRLRGSGVVVNIVDPGIATTDIFKSFPKSLSFLFVPLKLLSKTPWLGAQTILHAALDEKAGSVSGHLFRNCKVVKTSNIACDEDQAKRLWDKSVDLVKLSDDELIALYVGTTVICPSYCANVESTCIN